MVHRLVVTLVAVLAFPLPSWGQWKLILPQIDSLISFDGSGSYQRLLEEAARRARVTLSTEVLPKARALETFLAGEGEGIFTFTQTVREKLGAAWVLASYPLGAYRGFVFTSPGTPAVTDLRTLRGQKVGGVRGFEGTYGALTRAGALVELVPEDSQNLKKLSLGRVKAILAFLPDLTAQAKNLVYSPGHPFFESFDRLTVRNTPTNRPILERLSVAFAEMHRDGTAARIVGPGYLPVVGSFPADQ